MLFYLYYYLFSCNKQPMKRSNKIIDFVLTAITSGKKRDRKKKPNPAKLNSFRAL